MDHERSAPKTPRKHTFSTRPVKLVKLLNANIVKR